MAWLNYHHLLYFSTVAKRGSITAAAKELHLTEPAVSSQIKALERSLKTPLLVRRGRRLELTEVGRVVARYAEEIFALGSDLQATLAGQAPDRLAPLRIGVVDALPKLLVHRLLAPTLDLDPPHRVVILEDKRDPLLADLAIHELDVVFADAPAPPTIGVRAYSHQVLESSISFVAAPKLAAKLKGPFPKLLDRCPVLLPTADATLRRSLDAWFAAEGLVPQIVAEVADSAVIKTFGEQGAGVFAVPRVVEADVIKRYRVRLIGRTTQVREQIFAITADRRILHPGVKVLLDAARRTMGNARPRDSTLETR